jgi:glutathione S-transferase
VAFRPRSEYAKSDEYKKINPSGKIPSIKIGESALTESAAICLYLADRYGLGSFAEGIGSINRGKIYQWCLFAMTELDAHTLYTLYKHGGKMKKIYGESEVAAKTAREGFETQILKLENKLKSGKKYLVDNTFSVADILMGTCILFALNLELENLLEVPTNCTRYFSDLKKREAFKKASELNYPKTVSE